ncbi:hypothetical protein [Luedemannella helvata]|uniref:Flp pilus-assembly TadG-like N-terminal domain-containing protein n=1 Tax=Luedemannella helvata TaxID=349315 RepID=A0ABN2L032_9ACTN
MTRLTRAIDAQRKRMADDSGTSLIFALIFITVVAIVMGVVLSFAETNLRTTVAMRAQAARAAAADGAAKVAIDNLRSGSYLGDGNCFGADSQLRMDNFYSEAGRSGNVTGSVAVSCAPDEARTSVAPINDSNRPGNALITLGKPGDTDESSHAGDGIWVKINGGKNDTVVVKGGVFANSRINVFHGTLDAASVKARGACLGAIVPAVSCPNAAADIADPGYAAPTLPTNVRTPPACDAKEKDAVSFKPGVYNDVAALNAATGCKKLVYNFEPGVYYFNFNGVWNLDEGYVIGGTMTGAYRTSNPPDIATACHSPVPPDNPPADWEPVAGQQGVTFVFGGEARMYLTDDAQVALCGQYSPSRPATVIYGLKTSDSNQITRRKVPLISSYKNGNFQAYLFGTVYAPQAWVDLNLKKDLQFYFRGGVIVHHISIDGPGNTSTPTPMVATPDRSTQPSQAVVWLNVYLCPGAGTCTDTGQPSLRAKVGISEESGARRVTVLNWSVQR